MLLLCGCSGQENNLQETQSQVEDSVSSVSQTASALETDVKTQPVQQEVSQTSSAASQPDEPSSASQATPSARPEVETTPVAYQHSFHDIGTVGTCSTPGQHIYECTKCGYTEYGDIIPPEHSGKYTCEYCGIPLPEYPYIGVNVWLEESCGGAWNYQGSLGRCTVTPSYALDVYNITGVYYSTDEAQSLFFSIQEDGSLIMEFTGSTGYYHCSGIWDCSEITHDFAAQEVQGAYADPEMQQQYEAEFSQALENALAIFQQMISPFGFTLSTYGFTAW